MKLAENPDRFLSSVQVGITLIGLLTGMFSGNKIAAVFADRLSSMGMSHSLASGLSQTVIIVIVTYLSIVIGELVPKRIGMNSSEKVAKILAGPMGVISKIATPIVWVLSKSSAAIVKFLGIKGQESKVTEEEIKSIIKVGLLLSSIVLYGSISLCRDILSRIKPRLDPVAVLCGHIQFLINHPHLLRQPDILPVRD